MVHAEKEASLENAWLEITPLEYSQTHSPLGAPGEEMIISKDEGVIVVVCQGAEDDLTQHQGKYLLARQCLIR